MSTPEAAPRSASVNNAAVMVAVVVAVLVLEAMLVMLPVSVWTSRPAFPVAKAKFVALTVVLGCVGRVRRVRAVTTLGSVWYRAHVHQHVQESCVARTAVGAHAVHARPVRVAITQDSVCCRVSACLRAQVNRVDQMDVVPFAGNVRQTLSAVRRVFALWGEPVFPTAKEKSVAAMVVAVHAVRVQMA